MESEPKQTGEDKMILIHGLVKDEKMYIWGDGNAKGLIFDFTQTQEEPAKMGEKEIKSTQDIIDKLEEKKDKCRPDSISDDKFELPSKIEFMTL